MQLFTEERKPEIIKCITAIEELFGPEGQYWIKGEYRRITLDETLQKEMDSFCLSGAAFRANGPYEQEARIAITLAITTATPFEDLVEEVEMWGCVQEIRIVDYNDDEDITFAHIRNVLNKARELVPTLPIIEVKERGERGII